MMFKRSVLLALLLLPAFAQAPAGAQTLLRLEARGEAQRPADRMQARLVLERRADGQPAAAEALTGALAAAREAVADVAGAAMEAAEPRITVHPETGEAMARQELLLTAAVDAESLAALARILEGGALLRRVDWRLSTEAMAAAGEAATGAALRRLRERADQVAEALGLEVAALTQLSVEAVEAAGDAVRSRALPAEAAQAPAITVTVRVGGELQLRGRRGT